MEKILKIKSFIINKLLFGLNKKKDDDAKALHEEGEKQSKEVDKSPLLFFSNSFNDISHNISYLTPNSFHFINYNFSENEKLKCVKPPKIVKVPKIVFFDVVEGDYKKELNSCYATNQAQRQTINAVLKRRFLKSKQLNQNSLELLTYRELHMHRTSELHQKSFQDELMDMVFSGRPKVYEYNQDKIGITDESKRYMLHSNIIFKPKYSIDIKATKLLPVLREKTFKEHLPEEDGKNEELTKTTALVNEDCKLFVVETDDAVDESNDKIHRRENFVKSKKFTLLNKVFFLLINIFGSNSESKRKSSQNVSSFDYQ